MRTAGIACVARVAGIGIAVVPATSSAIMLGWIMCSRWRRLWGRSFWRLFVRRLFGILVAGVAIIATVILVARVGLVRSNRDGIQPGIAVIQLNSALIAHLAQRNLLLVCQVAANVGIFAIVLPALGQFVILLPVQAVDLVIEIGFEFSTGIWRFGLARVQHHGRSKQEGPDYKGMLFHTSLRGTFI